jgi:hypothetical protein
VSWLVTVGVKTFFVASNSVVSNYVEFKGELMHLFLTMRLTSLTFFQTPPTLIKLRSTIVRISCFMRLIGESLRS